MAWDHSDDSLLLEVKSDVNNIRALVLFRVWTFVIRLFSVNHYLYVSRRETIEQISRLSPPSRRLFISGQSPKVFIKWSFCSRHWSGSERYSAKRRSCHSRKSVCGSRDIMNFSLSMFLKSSADIRSRIWLRVSGRTSEPLFSFMFCLFTWIFVRFICIKNLNFII